MSRLIDADALQGLLACLWYENPAKLTGIKVSKLIDEQPTALVRCKDCKWYQQSELFKPTRFCFRLKDKYGGRVGYNFAEDDYCSYGERTEQDE